MPDVKSKPETIVYVMSIFNEEWGGKFALSDQRMEIWSTILADIDKEIILSAAMDMVSTGNAFPPTIGQLRAKCIDIKHGELRIISAPDAWVYVLAEIQKPEGSFSGLSGLTRGALKSVGTMFDLKRSENIGFERSHFIKAYTDLVEKQRIERVTLPSVKEVVNQNAPALPEAPQSEPPRFADPDDENRMLSDEERNEMLDGTIGDLSKAYSIDRKIGS